ITVTLSMMICISIIYALCCQKPNSAPRKAVYKFVKCNPEGDQANCVTQQSPSMAWSPDLPDPGRAVLDVLESELH
uniref:Prolactin receptor n=1 Tax=Gasterosteus aculeatus aculeatus TaxID=481459 RepID=A0AAQ4RY07_GASAC